MWRVGRLLNCVCDVLITSFAFNSGSRQAGIAFTADNISTVSANAAAAAAAVAVAVPTKPPPFSNLVHSCVF